MIRKNKFNNKERNSQYFAQNLKNGYIILIIIAVFTLTVHHYD